MHSHESAYYTRTQEGRDTLDRDVIQALDAGKEAAAEVTEYIGSTPQQTRASLNRHIENGLVTYKGRGPSTRYKLTAKGKRRAAKG